MWENLKLRILKKTTLIFLWLCIATLQEQHHRLGNDFDFEYQLCSHSHQNETGKITNGYLLLAYNFICRDLERLRRMEWFGE